MHFSTFNRSICNCISIINVYSIIFDTKWILIILEYHIFWRLLVSKILFTFKGSNFISENKQFQLFYLWISSTQCKSQRANSPSVCLSVHMNGYYIRVEIYYIFKTFWISRKHIHTHILYLYIYIYYRNHMIWLIHYKILEIKKRIHIILDNFLEYYIYLFQI